MELFGPPAPQTGGGDESTSRRAGEPTCDELTGARGGGSAAGEGNWERDAQSSGARVLRDRGRRSCLSISPSCSSRVLIDDFHHS